MPQQVLDKDMQGCIDECMRCYRECQQMAMGHCLETGGRHVEPAHFRLMMSCAEICRTSATIMLNRLPQHGVVCAACAEICEACADDCEAIGDMDACVTACRRCAESCRRMAANVAPTSRPASSGQRAQH